MSSSPPDDYHSLDLSAMTREEIGALVYKSYQECGGEKCRRAFDVMSEGFHKYTYDIFVGGELTYITRVTGRRLYIKDRGVAMRYFAIDYCRGDNWEAQKVYRAVDSVIWWT